MWIWDTLSDLSFVQFKKREKHPRMSNTLLKNTPSTVFYPFFKLYKLYQIVQSMGNKKRIKTHLEDDKQKWGTGNSIEVCSIYKIKSSRLSHSKDYCKNWSKIRGCRQKNSTTSAKHQKYSRLCSLNGWLFIKSKSETEKSVLSNWSP